MSAVLPDLERDLVAAAQRQLAPHTLQPGSTSRMERRSAHRLRGLRRPRRGLLALFAVLCLGGATGALAAAGVFRAGSPVASMVPPTPHAYGGIAIASTVKVLALRFTDPGGGPPWGLRVERTTRGLVCVQVGRVEYGSVGALGIDDALANDGRFHPFANNYLDPAGCGVADGHGHAFVATTLGNVPASAMEGSCAPNYLSRSSTGSVREVAVGRGPICPAGALRDISYGMLGPDALTITYADAAGRPVTIPTAGPEGAFLVISPAPAHCPSHVFGTGRNHFVSTYCIGATIGTKLTLGVIRKVTYRSGRTCVLPSPTETAATISCPSVGYVAPATQPVTSVQIASPVTVRNAGLQYFCRTGQALAPCGANPPKSAHRVPGPPAYVIEVSFIARIAVPNIGSYYTIALHYPTTHTPQCGIGGSVGPTNQDLYAGQHVDYPDYIPEKCTGTFRVIVSYKRPRYPPVPVGQTTFPLNSSHR